MGASMTDDELRRQAHKVAEALGLGRELPRYHCGRCGNKWLVEDMPRCPECGEYEDVAHIGMEFVAVDLLTEAGVATLLGILRKWHIGVVPEWTDEWGNDYMTYTVVVNRKKGKRSHASRRFSGRAKTRPAALVLAVAGALEAGWIGGVVGES
jgi:hypothetical protein